MTLDEAYKYLESLEPFIPRKTKDGKPLFDLNAVTLLLEALGNPQDSLKTVHIAGTNGKGSVANFMSRALSCAGYKTGRFTSPYLLDIREQISINGAQIEREAFAHVLTEVIREAKKLRSQEKAKPSEFEIVTAAVFLYFINECCDICIIEAGLGGRWDATNVIKSPLLSVITCVGFDHVAVLGDSLKEIADVKSGIIKRGCDVLVSSQNSDEALNVFKEKSQALSCNIYLSPEPKDIVFSSGGIDFIIERGEIRQNIHLPFGGAYQPVNAAIAYEALFLLKGKDFICSDEHIKKAFTEPQEPARFEKLSEMPLFIADGAHNIDGIKMLEKSLQAFFGDKKIIFIVGFLKDKDYEIMFDPVLHRVKKLFTVTPKNIRAMDAKDAETFFKKKGIKCRACENVKEVADAARLEAETDDIICAFGSFYYMGELRKYVKGVYCS